MRDIYSSFHRRKGLNGSTYHLKQMKQWIQNTKSTFETGDSQSQREALNDLMNTFFRAMDSNEMAGERVKTAAQAGLYSAQKGALDIISRRITQLQPGDRFILLRDFISRHLKYMGHSIQAAHDPQRKAVNMLAELLPTVIEYRNQRAALAALLLKRHTAGDIRTDAKAGRFNMKVLPTNDIAARLIGNEFREARRMSASLDPQIRAFVQGAFNQAIESYNPNIEERTDLHTKNWMKIFNDADLNPANWNKRKPGTFLRRRKGTAKYKTLDNTALKQKVEILMQENRRLKEQLPASGSIRSWTETVTRESSPQRPYRPTNEAFPVTLGTRQYSRSSRSSVSSKASSAGHASLS